jgi:hypothetical protein
MTPDRGVGQGHGGGVVQWWVVVEALVRAVVIEMALFLEGRPVNGQSAGINRHGEGDENALHRRSSDP